MFSFQQINPNSPWTILNKINKRHSIPHSFSRYATNIRIKKRLASVFHLVILYIFSILALLTCILYQLSPLYSVYYVCNHYGVFVMCYVYSVFSHHLTLLLMLPCFNLCSDLMENGYLEISTAWVYHLFICTISHSLHFLCVLRLSQCIWFMHLMYNCSFKRFKFWIAIIIMYIIC